MFAKIKPKKSVFGALLVLGLCAVALVIFVEGVNQSFKEKIYPGVYVNDIYVGGKTASEARDLIAQHIESQKNITLVNKEQSFEIPLESVDLDIDEEKSAQKAFETGRSKNRINNLISILRLQKPFTQIPFEVSYNEEKLDQSLSVIAEQTTVSPIHPSAKIDGSEIVVNPGKAGTQIDAEAIKSQIIDQTRYNNFQKIVFETQTLDPALTDSEVKNFADYASKFIGKGVVINYEFSNIDLKDSEIVKMLTPDGGIDKNLLKTKVESVANLLDREPQNSVFVFEEGRVKEFTPSKDGIKVDQDKLVDKISQTIIELSGSQEKQITITPEVVSTKPQITNGDVNNLGIRELIGRGTSTYKGSIASRVHNVALAASRINGVLVAPGETFSFNEALGDVSQLTGYKQAYVIKDGKTVLGDGGGVCQVSTTLFRAALNAGLPITERQGHSYRVGYYEQDAGPGLDATVYGPHPDLRIVNDTPASMLIQAKADTKNYSLVFEIYGTNDGRVATITKPTMTNVTAPPDDLYVDDPTLPTGQVKQVEHKAWGGRSTFNYEVKKDGNVTYQKTFTTNYRPWGAVYMRGTGPAI